MITLQAERPLDADNPPITGTSRASAPPPRAAPATDRTFEGRDHPMLVPSHVVGFSLAVAQATMLWPVLRPI